MRRRGDGIISVRRLFRELIEFDSRRWFLLRIDANFEAIIFLSNEDSKAEKVRCGLLQCPGGNIDLPYRFSDRCGAGTITSGRDVGMTSGSIASVGASKSSRTGDN